MVGELSVVPATAALRGLRRRRCALAVEFSQEAVLTNAQEQLQSLLELIDINNSVHESSERRHGRRNLQRWKALSSSED